MIVERLKRIDRQLDDGDIGFREHVGKDAPRPMIKATLIPVGADPHGLYLFGDFAGQFREAGRWILERE